MDIEQAKEKIAALEKEKSELIERIKNVNKQLRYKDYEKRALNPYLSSKSDVSIHPLRKRLKELEFRVSTEAYTAKIEKELIKEIEKLQEQLAKASEVEKVRRKQKFVEQDLGSLQKEQKELDEKIAGIRTQIKEIRTHIAELRYKQLENKRREEWEKRKAEEHKKRDEEERKEAEPYIAKVEDNFISLEDIAQIEHKKSKGAKEEEKEKEARAEESGEEKAEETANSASEEKEA